MTSEERQPSVDEAPYEQVMERLTDTVEALERGDLTLEEQIRRFEEGVKLVRRGQALLDEAERKVEVLLQGNETAPFKTADDGSEDAPSP